MNQWIENRKTVCIDFNGVLDQYQGYTGKMTPPRAGAKEFLQELKARKFKVVVLTACDPSDIEGWLHQYDMAEFVDMVTNVKVPAIVYLDDRGITFDGDFKLALYQIFNFMCFWETEANRETPKYENL